ncbi:hypothetical protein N5P37_001807 [Trichoderma harzianum]|nr:hypothetical protein N5P37_001807 [Trichoderma harzianum]
MTRLLSYLITFVTALTTIGFLFHQSKVSMPTIKEREQPEMRIDVVGSYLCDDKEEKKFRARFGRGPGVSVRGWPSKGGIYILERCFNIELDFLKLDKFHDTPQPSPSNPNAIAEEEAHCDRRKPFIKVGWPAGGGVWVLNITEDEAITRGVGIIYNASDMEHRCRLTEQLGGAFFKNPNDWLDLDLP